MSNELRNFLALSYDELEDLNLEAKEQRKNRVPAQIVSPPFTSGIERTQ